MLCAANCVTQERRRDLKCEMVGDLSAEVVLQLVTSFDTPPCRCPLPRNSGVARTMSSDTCQPPHVHCPENALITVRFERG